MAENHSKKLLVVIDMQNDFVSGALANHAAQELIGGIAKAIDKHMGDGGDLVFTRDTHDGEYLRTQEGELLPVEHCLRGSWGHEIVDGLLPQARRAKVIDKPAFGSTELGEYVRDNKYAEVTLVGVCTDICVISNAFVIKAFAPETKVTVRKALCAGVTPTSHEAALRAIAAAQIFVE